jgi:hypothetical protein
MITRVLERNEKAKTFLQAAAVHEAAHVIAAFHWDVPIGDRGVSITPASAGNDAVGYSDVLWATHQEQSVEENNAVAYASWVASVIAPFAEFQFRADDEDLDFQNLLSSCRGDFWAVLGTPATLGEVMSCAKACFLLWWGKEKQIPAGVLASETEHMMRDLVRDTDAMLRAYTEQIYAFANALLGADGFKMTPHDLAQWRDENFKRCDVELRGRAPRA